MVHLKLWIRGVQTERSFEKGTRWRTVAEELSEQLPQEALLVYDRKQNCILELWKSIEEDTEAEFLGYDDPAGRAAYARSAILMMLRAAYQVIPRKKLQQITVDFTLGNGFYIVPKGDFQLEEGILSEIQRRMEGYVSARMPFEKSSVETAEAIRRFTSYGMKDKAKLFSFRRSSQVNIYRLGDFEDYFYGPMCAHTGQIRGFSLVPYGDGFMLMLPEGRDPEKPAPFQPLKKFFAIQRESSLWAERIGVENLAELNEAICRGEANDLILMQEAFFEKKIGEIAQRIARKDRQIVLMAGPSSSGKTSTAHRLSLQLQAYGLRPHIISADDYFKDYQDRVLDDKGNPDFESLSAVDTERFNEDMLKLLRGEAVHLPRYNFTTGCREERRESLRLSEEDVLIIEGIHCLNEAFSEKLPRDQKYKIYVSALTQMNIDQHNRIPTADCRLLRRMVRDSRTRGYAAVDTIRRWPEVRRGEERNIFPYQEEAEVIFNTAMIYELAVLKQYAEPLLFSIPASAPEYLEAKRLLKFLDFVLPLSPEIIPGTSIVREFIGGSCFQVG